MSVPAANELESRLGVRGARFLRVAHSLHWGHWAFALFSLFITIGASLSVASAENARAERRFDGEIDRTVDLLTDRLQRYEDLLWASVAKIAAGEGRLTRADWTLFTHRLADVGEYPAVSGSAVGFAVPAAELSSFVATQRLDRPSFDPWPKGQAAVHLLLTYVQSEETQGRLEGLDASQEPSRAATILRAAQLNETRITAPMVTDSSGALDVVLLAPFYRGGEVPEPARRVEQLAGWTGLSIRVQDLVERVLSTNRRDIRIRVSDGETVLYDERGTALGHNDPAPLKSLSMEIPAYGRTWQLEATTAPGFREEFDGSAAWIVLAIGLLIDALAFSLLVMLSRTKARAERSALHITRSLQAAEQSFERANDELQSLAHVISYDLQLPLRDIGQLAERLRKDLAEPLTETMRRRLNSNLIRIHHITSRAAAVITGVLDYSRIQTPDEEAARCHLVQILDSVSEELNIDRRCLTGDGDVQVLTIRRNALEQVLTHLIDNAFSHHPDPQHARVSVRVQEREQHLRLSVTDDGIGIDPCHHARIFDLLHTVRPNAASDGVGVGLSIVRKIVERSGGSVSVRSALGKGATFIIDWPRAPESAGFADGGQPIDLPRAA